jgi:hypothetical protein
MKESLKLFFRQVLLYTNTTVYPGLLDWKANASE